ncbi:MAG: DUF4332 domain-containing protein [Roseiflexus sp.]
MAAHERESFDGDPCDGEVRSNAGWEERAAFRIALESRVMAQGRLVWRTRAYHEEHDQEKVWTGLPDEAIIEWFHERLRQSLGTPVSGDVTQDLSGTNAIAAGVALLPTAPSSESAAPPVAQPVEPSVGRSPQQDDLRQIPGIGPAIARRLHAAGVFTFAELAACTPAELAQYTGRSAEQIVRMGWIERARDLAQSVHAESQPALEAEEQETMVSEEPSIMFAAILLDEEGEVQDVHLSTVGETPPEWDDRRVARFFIETGASADTTPSNVTLHIDNPLIELIRARPARRDAYRLSANGTVRLEGLDHGTERVSGHMFLLAYNLDSHETHILNTAGVSLAAGGTGVPFTLESDLPDVGRYQLVLAAIVPEMCILVAVSGPPLRVTP